MATTTKSSTGVSVSFGNTPQAKDDTVTATYIGTNADSNGIIYLDVMANDLGGNAKTLYSLDDAVSPDATAKIHAPADLLVQDAVGVANNSKCGADISITADGKVAYNMDTDAFRHEFQSLVAGETGYDTFTYAVRLSNGTLSWATATVEIAGTNDAPVVANALTSETNEDADPYTVNLLTGASDVDHGAILHAGNVVEANGKGGWSVDGNAITINPDYYNDLNDGEFETLQLDYQVIDEYGASVNQALTVNIVGITDAPPLSVTTLSGAKVNEVLLEITSSRLAGTERVALTFANLPAGAIVLDQSSNNVTVGTPDYTGTAQFTVVLAENADANTDLSVTVTGFRDNGTLTGSKAQAVNLAYDVDSSTDILNFASANQNMWGDFPGYIGWHEYIPVLGGAPIVWNTQTGEWDSVAPDYWRSGQFKVVDVDLDSAKILEAVSVAATSVLDAAKAVFNGTAFVIDAVAQKAFDDAKTVLQAAENVYYFGSRTVDAVVKNTFQLAKDAYAVAEDLYDAASYAFHTVAKGVYDVAVAADIFGWFRGAIDAAYGLAEDIWDGAKYAFETTATDLYNDALATYNAAASAVDVAAQSTFDMAKQAFATAEGIYNHAKQLVYDAAQTVYDGVQSGVLAVINDVSNKITFDSALKVDSEVFAQVGLQVDFELDMGSVDTSIDYTLTSTTQYNKTTDMLAITPTMTNMTTGDSVAFDTTSPNAKFYAALLYDVGADFDVFIDGKLVVDNTPIYDLSPTSDGLAIQFPISTESFASALGVIAGGNIDVGKMVLVDLDSTKLGPIEVPFVEALTQNILTIELAIPTLETEGTAATYVPATADIWNADGTFEEQIGPFPYASIDFSEISSAFFNILNAKFDFSDEFMAAYGLDSLGGKTLEETVKEISTGLMANIWDVLGGQSEGVPIFVLDMTDETSSSLLHLNLFSDNVMADTTSANTGSLGFYAAYGESDPVVKVTVDLDAAYVAIVKAIAKAVASAVTVGAGTTIHPLIDAIPNPYNLEFGIEQVLKIASVPEETANQITSWINLGFSFEAADLDVSSEANFSQEFTLSIDDMSYLVTLEDGFTQTFTANGSGALLIENASFHDANGDGSIAYTLDIVPTAMFSNDTEIGLSLGYTLDFLKGSFEAGAQLPLNTLLGIQNADWLNIGFSAIDISMGPLLRVQGELDTLDVDVFETRFGLNIGSDSFAGVVDVNLIGIDNIAA